MAKSTVVVSTAESKCNGTVLHAFTPACSFKSKCFDVNNFGSPPYEYRIGHISANCPKPAGNKSCYNCGGEGHIAKDCPNPRSDD